MPELIRFELNNFFLFFFLFFSFLVASFYWHTTKYSISSFILDAYMCTRSKSIRNIFRNIEHGRVRDANTHMHILDITYSCFASPENFFFLLFFFDNDRYIFVRWMGRINISLRWSVTVRACKVHSGNSCRKVFQSFICLKWLL